MKVILLKDIPNIGRKYEVKNVSDGHALNLLIPQKLAEAATKAALARLEQAKKREADGAKVKEELAFKSIEALKGKKITLREKANEKGHLFSGIHADEIKDSLAKEHRIELSKESILLDQPIKEIGERTVKIKIGDKEISLKVVVESL